MSSKGYVDGSWFRLYDINDGDSQYPSMVGFEDFEKPCLETSGHKYILDGICFDNGYCSDIVFDIFVELSQEEYEKLEKELEENDWKEEFEERMCIEYRPVRGDLWVRATIEDNRIKFYKNDDKSRNCLCGTEYKKDEDAYIFFLSGFESCETDAYYLSSVSAKEDIPKLEELCKQILKNLTQEKVIPSHFKKLIADALKEEIEKNDIDQEDRDDI